VSIKIRKAVHQHRCSCCAEVIKKGDTYEVHKGIVMDSECVSFTSLIGKLCTRCSDKGRKPYLQEGGRLLVNGQ